MDPDEPSTSPTLTARGGVSGTQAVGTVPGTPTTLRRRRRVVGGLHRWLLAPSVLVLGAVVLFPLIYSVNLSLRHYNPTLPDATGGWAGLSNYARCCTTVSFTTPSW